MAVIAVPGGLSPYGNFSFPKFGAPNVGGAYREAAELARRYAPAAKQGARSLFRVGTRIGTRAIPLMLAVEAGWFAKDLYDHLHPIGPVTLMMTGPWVVVEDCGRSPQKGTRGASWPSCASDLPIGPTAASDTFPDGAQGFIKAINFWEIYPIRRYINGDILGKGAVGYQQVSGPPISIRNNIAAIHPMLDAEWYVPRTLALYPSAAPILAPRPREEPIPFPVLPHIPSNPASGTSVQGYVQSYNPPVVETFPAEPIAQPHVEIFPVIIDILNPNGGAIARPGVGIEITPSNPVQARAIATTHFQRPPQKGEKERKFKLNPTARNLVVQLFNTATELDDFLDALYWAIEPKYTGNIVHGRKLYDRERLKGRKVWFKGPDGKWKSRWVNNPSLQEKADWIYRNLDGLDLGQALENFITNEIEDRVYGTIGKAHGKAARAIHDSGLHSPARSSTLSRGSGIETGSGRLPVDEVLDAVKDYINKAFS